MRKAVFSTLACVGCLAVSTLYAQPAEAAWTVVGAGAFNVIDIASDGQTLYALTTNANTSFKSGDGTTWQFVNWNGLPSGTTLKRVFATGGHYYAMDQTGGFWERGDTAWTKLGQYSSYKHDGSRYMGLTIATNGIGDYEMTHSGDTGTSSGAFLHINDKNRNSGISWGMQVAGGYLTWLVLGTAGGGAKPWQTGARKVWRYQRDGSTNFKKVQLSIEDSTTKYNRGFVAFASSGSVLYGIDAEREPYKLVGTTFRHWGHATPAQSTLAKSMVQSFAVIGSRFVVQLKDGGGVYKSVGSPKPTGWLANKVVAGEQPWFSRVVSHGGKFYAATSKGIVRQSP